MHLGKIAWSKFKHNGQAVLLVGFISETSVKQLFCESEFVEES